MSTPNIGFTEEIREISVTLVEKICLICNYAELFLFCPSIIQQFCKQSMKAKIDCLNRQADPDLSS